MFTRKLLLLASLTFSEFCTDTTSICKLVPDFGGNGNTIITKHNETSPFCKTLNTTCCSKDDFEKMKKVWEEKEGNKSSIRDERTKEMKNAVELVQFLSKADSDLFWLSQEIKKEKTNADPACSTPAYIHRQMKELNLIKTAVTTFKQTGNRCWNYTKNLMNGLMCAACDARAQDYIDNKKKEITISSNECSTFIRYCGEHLKAINSVFFYYNTYQQLTYCNTKGKISVDVVPKFTNIPKSIKQAIDGCLNSNNRDDCVAACQSQIGFTTMANFEYQNKQRMADDQKTVLDFLAKSGSTKQAETPVAKRILADDPPAPPTPPPLISPNVEETLRRLNLYNIRVSKFGLDLTKYTLDNKDGYTDIDLGKVFSAKLLVVASFWLFLASF